LKGEVRNIKIKNILPLLTILLLLTALTYLPTAWANGGLTWSDMDNNSTIAGGECECSIKWQDDVELDTYVFSTNNTGVWANVTESFGTGNTVAWANQTITLNDTVGVLVQSKWYANDTSDNWAVSDLLNITTTEEDTMSDMMGIMSFMGMLTKLDIQVQTGVVNLMTEMATIYIQISQGGVPTDIETLNVTLIYDSPNCWTDSPPWFFGQWNYDNETTTPDPDQDICDWIWADENKDWVVDEDEKIHIPGLYVVTVCYGGFRPGDYLIWAYAEAPFDIGFNMTEMGGDGTGFGDMRLRGVGTGGFTVSEDMTILALGFPELASGFQTMGEALETMMEDMESMWDSMAANTEEMSGTMSDMVEYQENMAGVIEEMTSKMESMLDSTQDMMVFQDDMLSRFDEFKTGLDEFQEGLSATKLLMDDLLSEVAIVKADVGETTSALPVLYQEASDFQQMTMASLPIAQVLSGIAAVLSLVAVALLVRINKKAFD